MKLPPAREDPVWKRLREHDVAELWDHSIAPHVAAAYASRMALLRRLIADFAPPRGRVLDIGCAQGTLGLSLAEAGYRVTLLDVRSQSIEYAKARYEHGDVRFVVGTISADCPPDSDFDAVICTEVLEHAASPSRLLESARRKLRPGGIFLLSTPNANYFLNRLPTYGSAAQEVVDAAEADSMDGDAHRYLFTREELVALVRSVGLRVLASGFLSPFWLEGHLKTRYLHRLRFKVFGGPLGALGRTWSAPSGRWLCATQWLVAGRPADPAPETSPRPEGEVA